MLVFFTELLWIKELKEFENMLCGSLNFLIVILLSVFFRTLVAKNLIPVESRLQIQPVTQKQAPDGSLGPSNNIIKDSVRTQSTANVNSNVDTTNDKTETGVSEAPVSTVNTQSGEASAEPLTLPGSSRSSQRAVSGNRRSKSFATLYKFCIPEIPDTNSESETDYSCQGYETGKLEGDEVS